MKLVPLFEESTPYTDEHGKLIVYDNGDYKISVDDETNCKYVALWYDGKKVGHIATRNFGTKDALGINLIEIDKKHRGTGMATTMLNTLMKHMSSKYEYMVAYQPEIVSPKMKKWFDKRKSRVDGDMIYVKRPA